MKRERSKDLLVIFFFFSFYTLPFLIALFSHIGIFRWNESFLKRSRTSDQKRGRQKIRQKNHKRKKKKSPFSFPSPTYPSSPPKKGPSSLQTLSSPSYFSSYFFSSPCHPENFTSIVFSFLSFFLVFFFPFFFFFFFLLSSLTGSLPGVFESLSLHYDRFSYFVLPSSNRN